MEISKSIKREKLKQFNLKLDETKPKDVLENDIVKVHDFFTNSQKIDKMSDIFPKTEKQNDDILF